MKEKKITIAGKEIMLAYCYATEINFHALSGIDFQEFIQSMSQGKQLDPKITLHAILAASLAYYDYHGEEMPIIDKDLMYNAQPKELIDALTAIVAIRNEWYQLPAGEPEDKPDKTKKGKRSKN